MSATSIICQMVGDESKSEWTRFGGKQADKDIKLGTEQVDSVKEFIEANNPLQVCLFPNFDFGWLTSFSGYVASFDINAPFKSDPFMFEYFRVISLFEIQYDLKLFHRLDNLRRDVRKTIPETTPFFPNLEDNETMGWSYALGEYGAQIGIYETTESKESTEQAEVRRFIVVKSGLHRQTVTRLQNQDVETNNRNKKLTDEVNFADLSVSEERPMSVQGYVSFADEFANGSIKETQLNIAKENNRRLAIAFKEASDLVFLDKVPTRISIDNKYRTLTPPISIENLDMGVLDSALTWWPRRVMITPSTILPSDVPDGSCVPEAKECFLPQKLRGYRLGEILVRHADQLFVPQVKS